jgi:hypothetical protein
MNKPLLFAIFKTPNRQIAYTLLPFLGTVPLISQIIPIVTFRIPHKRVKSWGISSQFTVWQQTGRPGFNPRQQQNDFFL